MIKISVLLVGIKIPLWEAKLQVMGMQGTYLRFADWKCQYTQLDSSSSGKWRKMQVEAREHPLSSYLITSLRFSLRQSLHCLCSLSVIQYPKKKKLYSYKFHLFMPSYVDVEFYIAHLDWLGMSSIIMISFFIFYQRDNDRIGPCALINFLIWYFYF